jgi:hypothetical protein
MAKSRAPWNSPTATPFSFTGKLSSLLADRMFVSGVITKIGTSAQRMKKAGWESHYVANTTCISIQQNTLKELAAKHSRHSNWYSPSESSLFRLYAHLTKWTLIRV